jgi:hypothetical protein
MYVVAIHQIIDQAKFWPANVAELTKPIPPHLKLHHTFAGTDGSQAVCLWEAESVDALRSWLDPFSAGASVNSYFPAVNKAGLAIPATRRATQRA